MNLEQIQNKRREFAEMITESQDRLTKAREILAMDPTAERADTVRQLEHAVENYQLALESAQGLEKRIAEGNTGEIAQKDAKRISELEARAGQKRAEILRSIEKMSGLFGELDELTNEHRRLAARYNKTGIQFKADYRLIFALQHDLETWLETWRRFQKIKALQGQPDKPTQLTNFQKKVESMRYHGADDPIKTVRLVENDRGPITDPKKIRAG